MGSQALGSRKPGEGLMRSDCQVCSGRRRDEVGVFWLHGWQEHEDLTGDPSGSSGSGPQLCKGQRRNPPPQIAQTSGLGSSTANLCMIPSARPSEPCCFEALFPAGWLWGAVEDLPCWWLSSFFFSKTLLPSGVFLFPSCPGLSAAS